MLSLISVLTAATVTLPVKTEYTVSCNPAEAPVSLTISDDLSDVYSCTQTRDPLGQPVATYRPSIENVTVSLGANTFQGAVQEKVYSGRCERAGDFVVVYISNDHGRYILALYADGSATIARQGNMLCSTQRPLPSAPARR